MSIQNHVNFSINVGGVSAASAGFGTQVIVAEHTVTANRLDGPYTGISGVTDAGFTAAAAPAAYAAAAQHFAQQPRSSQLYIGRRGSGEHFVTAMDLIEAAGPAKFYAVQNVLNTADELLATGIWTETRNKIALLQTSAAEVLAGTASTAQNSTFTVGGTAASGVYSIAVYNAWTNVLIGTASVTADVPGTHADNDAIAAALRTAWDAVAELAAISAAAGGAGAVVDIDFDGLGNSYTFVLTQPGGATITEGGTAPTQNAAKLLKALALDNTSLWYHDDDTEYLDASVLARCLAFNLDAPGGAGTWAYHTLKSITGSALTSAQKAQLLADNVNWYSPTVYTSGVEEPAFTFPGKMVSGRYIDITTTNHVTVARMEEAFTKAFIKASASSRPKIPYTDEGIAIIQSLPLSVLNRLVTAGHYAKDAVSQVTGRKTPWVDVPSAAEISAATKQGRTITLTGEAIYAGAIHSVGDASSVGFTLDLNFA